MNPRGGSPVRIVLAGSDVYVINPGEAGGSGSGNNPRWTHCMDEIPAGKLYSV